MIRRRAVLAGAASAILPALPRAAAAEPLPGVPANGRIAFEVFRNDARIGTHTLDFTSAGPNVSVRITVRFAVGLGPITLYRYAMDGTEQWSAGRFVALDTQTDDDGTPHQVSIRRSGDGLLVRATGEPDRSLPGAALPLTHWAVAAMAAPLFNPQDGKPLDERAVASGNDAIRLLNGDTVQARVYRLSGDLALRDWYDDAQLWVKLRAKGKDGSDIDYRRA